jgi:hypothetical protein
MHCPFEPWTPQAWPALDGLPSLAQTMVDAAALPMPVEALQEIITQDEAERLYQGVVEIVKTCGSYRIAGLPTTMCIGVSP